ncbi:FAD/NAD(P)-binding oxidoreductase family protein [Hibiscus syriacus]|uniref:FAD/NAD(P)-binding oxidoreductase family protein n=1 Tax=Hibiscus syriacus TaxID=106335 RepID=A0A6A2XEY8_HIBSY|nr:FAD/NAD(P)-binding oxidoreductase family protein [Hibiscus syriacus]
MDSSFYNESNKLNVLNSSNIPKLMTIPVRSRGNYYSSPDNLIKYLRSNSVSSSGGNSSSSGKSCFRSSVSPQSEKTPLKVVDEDVFIMDGVLVASDTNIIDSGSSSSGSFGFYKSEICRAWDEFGHCRYGSKCQFAHGKEDVHPTCFPFRTKSEVYKSYASTVPNTFGSKPRLLHLLATPIITQKDSSTRLEETKPETTRSNTNFAMKHGAKNISPTSTIGPDTTATTTFTIGANWSPQDDGIDVTLPTSFPGKTPSRENIDAYIDGVLYGGPTPKKRLPVFSAICPEE